MNSTPPPITGSETAEVSAPPQPSLGLKIATGLATTLSLFILLASARVTYGSGEESRMIGYVIGGIVFWPGVVTIIFSLSKKHRSPRRSCSAWLVATCVIACLNLFTLFSSMRATDRAHNEEVMDSMQSNNLEMGEELFETDDLDRVAELQKQVINNLEDSVAQLTGDPQRFAKAAVDVMRPLIQASEDYTAASAQLFEQLDDAIRDTESGEGFTAVAQTLEGLIQQHDELIAFIVDFDARAQRSLAQTDLTTSEQEELFIGVKLGFDPQVPFLKEVRRTEAEMFVLYREWIALLSDRWVEWERDEEFVFTWSTDEGLAVHNEIFERLGELGEEQNVAQQGLLEVTRKMQR